MLRCTQLSTKGVGKHIFFAEGEGFEPSVPIRYNSFQDCRNRPLCQPSKFDRINVNLSFPDKCFSSRSTQ